jgi:predicted small lipoprotein YifL
MTSLAHVSIFDLSLMFKNNKFGGLILVCLLGLSACGQKGPLTMPAESISNQPAEPTSPDISNQQEPR